MPGGFQLEGGGCYVNYGVTAGSTTGTTVTASSANTKGSYAQLTSSTTYDIFGFMLYSVMITGVQFSYDIAVGGAGSEKIIVPNFVHGNTTGQTTFCQYFPIFIPSGTRIAVRGCGASGGATTAACFVQGFQANFAGLPLFGSAESYGYTSASTRGTNIDPGGTAHTKGSYTQLTASTTYDIRALIPLMPWGNASVSSGTRNLIDIAYGGAGSEQIVIPDIMWGCGGATNPTGQFPLYYVDIPASSRIAARCQSTITTATSRTVDVCILGFR